MEETRVGTGLEAMPEWARAVVEEVMEDVRETSDVGVRRLSGSSNEMMEVSFGPDRTLMVKRGQHHWSHEMFDTAERAAALLDSRSDVTAPLPLPLRSPGSTDPIQAYWRIPLPTLGELWPDLSAEERRDALTSLGQLLSRVHDIRLPGWGGLSGLEEESSSLERFLHQDLGERLLPAVYAFWSEGAWPIEQLIGEIETIAKRSRASGVFSHGDLHIQNVLCEKTNGAVECVGLLDLDNVRAAPPEWDVASFNVLHGPLFAQHIEERERSAFLEGYGEAIDPVLLAFFRAYHLANLGFASALIGDDLHAGLVAEALIEEVRLFRVIMEDVQR